VASRAEASFVKNCEDIDQLLKIHTDITGAGHGAGKLEALHKSAIVLLTAFWEAFCEDLAAEALQHVVDHARTARVLPVELRKQVAKELADRKNDLAVWELAGDGWRPLLVSRLERLQEQRNRKLNTPKTQQINDLFREALGIEEISESWHWGGMTAPRAAKKLDEFITVRHEVAHRGSATYTVWKYDVNDYYNHVRRLVGRTAAEIARVLTDVTGVTAWPDEANT
jgi:hypothetical protein